MQMLPEDIEPPSATVTWYLSFFFHVTLLVFKKNKQTKNTDLEQLNLSEHRELNEESFFLFYIH